MYKKIISNSVLFGILPQLPKVAALFVLPLTTPFLTKVDYGVVGTITSYTYATSVFHLLGLEAIIQNAYFRYPSQYKWFWRQLFGFITLWSFIYIAALAILLYNIIPAEAAAYRWQIVLIKVVPLLLFVPSDFFTQTYYVLKQRAWPVVSRSLIIGFISLSLNFYFIAVEKRGYMGWLIAECIAGLISGFIFCYPLFFKWGITPIFNFKRRLVKGALKLSLPLIPHNYASYILDSSDRVIMERYKIPTGDIGRYSLAYQFGKYVETVTNAASQAIGPSLSHFIKFKKWPEYERLIFYFQSFALIMCFTLALWVPQWLPVLIRNKEMQNIQYFIVIIIMSYCYRPLFIGTSQIAYYNEKGSVLWRITLVAGIINIVLNIIFIPIFGLYAAALVTFFAFLVVGFMGFTFKFYREIKELNLQPVFWFLLIISILVISLLLLHESVIIKLIANLFLLPFLYLSSKLLLNKRI